jgi:kynurenine formamidase
MSRLTAMPRASAVVLCLLALVACATNPRPEKVLDMTHSFGEETVYWPGNEGFRWEQTTWGMTEGGYWYASGNFSASEHGGTHIDAPIHFAQGRSTLDQISVDHLIGPAVVIDVRKPCEVNPDYTLSIQDIHDWEAAYGRIPNGAVVFMYSGWGRRWADHASYLGSTDLSDPYSLHFPGFSRAAAEFLVTQRTVHGVGIDTASIDPGPSRNFPAHQAFNSADVYALENVAALDQLPPRGATVVALPMKITGGSGGPVRIIAFIP